jgi:hypothetical protein
LRPQHDTSLYPLPRYFVLLEQNLMFCLFHLHSCSLSLMLMQSSAAHSLSCMYARINLRLFTWHRKSVMDRSLKSGIPWSCTIFLCWMAISSNQHCIFFE